MQKTEFFLHFFQFSEQPNAKRNSSNTSLQNVAIQHPSNYAKDYKQLKKNRKEKNKVRKYCPAQYQNKIFSGKCEKRRKQISRAQDGPEQYK